MCGEELEAAGTGSRSDQSSARDSHHLCLPKAVADSSSTSEASGSPCARRVGRRVSSHAPRSLLRRRFDAPCPRIILTSVFLLTPGAWATRHASTPFRASESRSTSDRTASLGTSCRTGSSQLPPAPGWTRIARWRPSERWCGRWRRGWM